MHEPLDIEFDTYERSLDGLLASHAGEYVVIKGTDVLRFFDSYKSALEWAYEQFGLERFFVKQVLPDQLVLVYDEPAREFRLIV